MHARAAADHAPGRPIRIGPADDAMEREADRVAGMLTAGPTPKPAGCACDDGGGPCPACAARAREEMLRRSPLGPAPSRAPSGFAPPAPGAGRPLPASVRAKFERQLGVYLSPLRLHTGPRAASAAAAVSARAFALGDDIVFGARAPAPETAEGERLLAHEVAHTLQPGAGSTVRRVPDLTVVDTPPGAAADTSTLYFDYASTTLDAAEQGKITALATPSSQDLTLFGYASEEGSAADRTTTATARIAEVSRRLRNAGHAAARTPSVDISRGEGNIDYRSMRAVAVVPTPSGGGPAVSPLGSGVCNPVEPCGTAFSTALPVAMSKLVTAIAMIAANTPAAAAQLSTLFPGTPAATVMTGLSGLAGQLGVMTANHQCHNACDAGCSRPAYMSGSGATAMMTLCPGFLNDPSIDERALLLLHEGLHAVPGLTTVDFAYRHSRFIDFIPAAQAVTNTDSYVLLILRLSGGGGSGPPVDPVGSLPGPDQLPAQRALAFTEQWLLNAEWDTVNLYEKITTNRGRAGGWQTADEYYATVQHAIAGTFAMTDPGTTSPFAAPTMDDQVKAAGLHDRYERMMRAIWMIPVTVNSTAAGPEAWAANLGPAVTVTPAFFALGAADQVLRLIELMAGSLPTRDVPSSRRRDYAVGAQQMWLNAGRTGP